MSREHKKPVRRKPKPTPIAYPIGQAAKALGISRTQFWRLRNLPDSDPQKIRCTPYGRVPVSELQRHLTTCVETETPRTERQAA